VPGIVLIDEIDLHLHPQWQKTIVGSLRETFPKVQVVTTTHSPQVLSTVDASKIRVLKDSQVLRPRYSEGLRSDIVLSTVLDTPAEPDSEKRDRLRVYLSLVDAGKGKTPKATDLREEIELDMGGIDKVPELADADAAMTFQELIEK
jgi:predicted ATP-binding protein involved in virulence